MEEVEQFVRERGEEVDEFLGHFPACYQGDSGDSVLVLEDITAAGYWGCEQLDLQHVLVIMKALGKLHGLFAAFRGNAVKLYYTSHGTIAC